uniref:Uncharacterized protein n=1 Tax=Arcella intermedia TaxID=1963864 RepID=A0A6B2LAI7_9EUKA
MICSSSSRNVFVYSVETGSLISKISEQHGDRISGLGSTPHQPNLFCTSCMDGSVKFWDIRQKTNIKTFNSNLELSCVDLSGDLSTVVSAGDTTVILWDFNTGKVAGQYADIHSEEIVSVRVHPKSGFIYSGGIDGLVSIFDMSLGTTEDDTYVSALNCENAISKMGFFGTENEYLWASTLVEELSLFELTNESLLSTSKSIREHLSSLSGTPIQSLIDCKYNKSSTSLTLFAGTLEGGFSLFSVARNEVSFIESLPQIHTDVVRTISTHQNHLLVTGGDDGLVAFWTKGDHHNTTKETKFLQSCNKVVHQ